MYHGLIPLLCIQYQHLLNCEAAKVQVVLEAKHFVSVKNQVGGNDHLTFYPNRTEYVIINLLQNILRPYWRRGY